MPGARCARSRAWCVVNTRVSHHGHTGTTRHSPRNGFNGCFALSPVTGLSCHRHRRNCFRQLDTSVGVSGPHDFAVRKKHPRLWRYQRPPRPAAHVRDDRETPLEMRRDRISILLICPGRQAKFLKIRNHSMPSIWYGGAAAQFVGRIMIRRDESPRWRATPSAPTRPYGLRREKSAKMPLTGHQLSFSRWSRFAARKLSQSPTIELFQRSMFVCHRRYGRVVELVTIRILLRMSRRQQLD
jgi:hypothetical protein